MDELRARVFISCGQNKKSDEPELANEISRRLKALGFEPYVAVEEQTLAGIQENIFKRLRNSEYFIFVDFKRERLKGKKLHRGSLYSHQELAVASFLQIDALAFQERGVRSDDGMLGFIQGNPISFSNRERLPVLVARHVRRHIKNGTWSPKWKNELALEREPTQFTNALNIQTNKVGRYFQIGVRNRHRLNTALHCCVYLKEIMALDTKEVTQLPIVEFKWEATTLPSAHIHPDSVRRFDAFFILHEMPQRLQFNAYCGFSLFLPVIEGPGRQYKLTYVVVADNFPPARGSFVLSLTGLLDTTTLLEAD